MCLRAKACLPLLYDHTSLTASPRGVSIVICDTLEIFRATCDLGWSLFRLQLGA